MVFAGYQLDIDDYVHVTYNDMMPWDNEPQVNIYEGKVDGIFPNSEGGVTMRVALHSGGHAYIIDMNVISLFNVDRDLLINI